MRNPASGSKQNLLHEAGHGVGEGYKTNALMSKQLSYGSVSDPHRRSRRAAGS